MSRRYYFLLSFLPGLGELGARPGIEPSAFRAAAWEDDRAGEIADSVLLERDLLAREGFLAGEIEDPEPLVLSVEQVRGEQPLPDALAGVERPGRRVAADAVWEAYYRHVARTARRTGCEFLRSCVGFEVALRNAVAAERARTLELDPSGYLVAEDLADEDAPVGGIVAAWASAPDPLRGLRALDEARREWAATRSRYFSFTLDELAAYARNLVLLDRWRRLAGEERPSGSGRAA